MSTSASDANFSDQVPEHYDREMGPVFFESHAQAMAERLPSKPGIQVLEIAAGTGRVTRHLLAKLPPDGKLTVTDLHPDMMAIAQQTIDDPRIEWRQADALELPFEENSFDVVVCEFGAMFYPDKVAGHREALRVLKAGGTYLLATWSPHSENRWAATIHAKMGEIFPDDPPRFMNKPFSYGSIDAVKTDLAEAGFVEPCVEIVAHDLVVEDLPRTLRGMLLGSPLGAAIVERNGDLDQISRLLAQDFKAFGGDSPHRSTKTALFFTARKPK